MRTASSLARAFIISTISGVMVGGADGFGVKAAGAGELGVIGSSIFVTKRFPTH